MQRKKNPKPRAETRAAKPNSTHGKKVKVSTYKQFNEQNRVTRSVYCEHRDRVDQFAPAKATQPSSMIIHIQ